jgi:hypothetical protein
MEDLLFGGELLEENVTIQMLGDDLKKRSEIRKSRANEETSEEIDTEAGTHAALAMLLSRIYACKQYAEEFIKDSLRDPRAHGLSDASKVFLNTLNGTNFKDVVSYEMPKYTHFSPTAVDTNPDPVTQLRYKHKESEVEIHLLAIDVICANSPESKILFRHLENGDLEVLDKETFDATYELVKESPGESPAELPPEETDSEASLKASKKKKAKRKQQKDSRKRNR